MSKFSRIEGGYPVSLLYLTKPMTWPRYVRRLFLLGFPVAVILWAAAFIGAFFYAESLKIWGRFDKFWNGRRRHIYRYHDYQYRKPLE